jgi:hypothetical protein
VLKNLGRFGDCDCLRRHSTSGRLTEHGVIDRENEDMFSGNRATFSRQPPERQRDQENVVCPL